MSCVVVFGRVPVPGRVKTRLAAAIGAEAAAGVYRAMLGHCLRTALDSAARVVLSLAEAPPPGWCPPVAVDWEVQGPGDLGARMAEAFDRRFSEGRRRVVVIGSDCPEVEAGHLVSAIERLRDVEALLGPAVDGGYWLVGQRAPGRDLFSGVPWSSPFTMAATVDRLRTLGATWTELERLVDVDTAADLRAVLIRDRLNAELARALSSPLPSGWVGELRADR